ncbi:hsp70 family protein [Pendulispora brunnea]|uniref:Hsp70 family protein n=1 Tax=Pendulispora brunnea TaxID=2905690 RepID=A0ABZ2KS68_9BACT
MRTSARVVGIDLGTTNTLLAWADAEGPDRTPRIFAVPQLVTRTEIEARALLPSCLFAPAAGEIEGDPFHDAPYVTGEFARQRGAQVPGRLIASAKSWLCHAGVDRTAAILPWGSDDESVPKVSPLDASTRYLAHLKTAYDAAHPDTPLADTEVVLTVPASFDEGARELTLEAATRAGLNVRLLEEPQAAFYDCMQRIGTAGLEALIAGTQAAHVLVCDVGGGTTDLSLIRVERGESGPVVSRIATGHHLLLGGDNMDLTLAHLCEERLETKFDPGRFAQLTAACRTAKERLLGGQGENVPEEAAVTVLGHGAKLVGGSLSTKLTRDEVERIVLEGFFPKVERDARPQRTRGALVAFGLPYERDVAITRHIAWFVARHVGSGTRIDALLLNGGVFRATRIAERVAEVVSSWHPEGAPGPAVLPHPDPDFGVARGAVAYALALRGHGVRIQGGAAHGYYVALGDGTKAVSVVPRGTKEDVTAVAEGVPLALTVGRPVRFDLFAADDARIDPAGTVVPLDEEHFRPLPPAAVTFRAEGKEEKGEKREIAVVLEGKLSAIGTLDLACVESDPPAGKAPRRFRLAFQLRAPAVERERTTSIPPATSLRGKKFDAAHDLIDRAFGKPRQDASPRDVKDLVRELERLLGERSSWTMLDARTLYDALIPLARNRRRTADHERVFWLLAGYCLRPGFGDPHDSARVSRLASLFSEKLAFVDGPRGWQQFFIAWRRVAAGLDEAAQTQIVDTFEAFVAPPDRGIKKPKKLKPEALDDLLEMLSTLERLPPQRRAELGSYILERTWTDRDPRLWAALGRLGARVPAYASVHHVVSAITAERWLDHLLREKWEQVPTATRAAVELARMTGDRARDVGERVRRDVEKRLVKLAAKPEWIRAVREHVPVEESDRAAFYGEGLPLGLRLMEE